MKHRILLVCVLTFFVLSSLPAIPISWETTAEAYKGRYGQTLTFELPPNGIAKPVYGFGEFEWDSSIGSAAVQMGLLTYENGGEVTILIKEGPEYIQYEGWNTTFVYLDAKGNVVKPDESFILFIDIHDEPFQPSRDPDPVYFTVSNQTGTTLTYLDISTTDMRAVGAHGKNLLSTSLVPDRSTTIPFSDNSDLKSIILYRYAALLRVDARAENGQLYSLEWRPDPSAPAVVIQSGHLVQNQSSTTLSVTNECEYVLVELYILTPKMEAELDYSKELLQGSVLASGESISIKLSSWPYLQSFLETEAMGILAVEAYDEDGYQLLQYWLPDKENLQIVLSDWDYL
ncbi:MAG: hypothetical protein EOM32_13740 [Spirochaetia bacterium]|nr:hypothetical protein [Spirochaetia bacterium]